MATVTSMDFFILGSQSELAQAEIKAVLKKELIIVESSPCVIISQPIRCDLTELQERLAGIVKTGKIIGELYRWSDNEVTELVASNALRSQGKNKINFGLSVYDIGGSKRTQELERDLDKIGLIVKRLLKESRRPVRYVKSKEPRLSSAVVETNGLLSSGGEFIFFVADKKIYIGKTETVQNFRSWEKRDFGRPARDAKNGMLPPKLARMMINLSGIEPEGATLLDPFCGSGTVIMEAALMGFRRIIGSDISKKAVDNTQKNLAWIANNFQIQKTDFLFLEIPASKTASHIHEQIDILVTEVDLGKPRTREITDSEAQMLEKELLPLYAASFRELKKLAKPATKFIVAFPAYKKHSGQWRRLQISKFLTELGFKIQQQYLYHRDNQLVGRDITIFSL